MESLEEIAKRISDENRASRERFSSFAVRTARAVFEKDADELSRITEEATALETDGPGSGEGETETGALDGSDREQGT